MSDRTDTIASRKIELLQRRLRKEGLAGAVEQHLSDTSGELSFGQQRLWFLDRFLPGSGAYNIPAALRIDGPLNIEVLNEAFRTVIRRHDVLRAVFREKDGKPIQQILPDVSFSLEVTGSISADSALESFAREASLPFDLTCGPLLRASLYRVHEEDHILGIVLHHIVADGASIEILIHEISKVCLDLVSGGTNPLKPLPCQYAGYIAWEQKQSRKGAWTRDLEYWRRQLSGIPALNAIPTDLPRGPARYQGEKYEYKLDPALSAPLRSLAAGSNTTGFTVFLCALQVLLSRQASWTEVPIGIPSNHRPKAEFMELVGFFVNTLVIRSRLTPRISLMEHLAATRQTVLDALEHQAVPFELLVRELNPDRITGNAPLVQVMFNYQPMSVLRSRGAGLTFRPIPVRTRFAKMDLTVYVQEKLEGFVIIFEYDTSIYLAETVAAMARSYAEILRAATVRPHGNAAEAPPPECAGQWRFESTPRVVAHGSLIHAEFEARAMQTASDIALETSVGSPITYGELSRRSDALARELVALGAGPGQLIAISLPREASLVIAMLAVLMSGAAYLPLDPRQPAARTNAVMDEARPLLVIKDSETVVRTGHQRRAAEAHADLAYVLFTSGSTGKPKGVAVRHAAVLNIVYAMRDQIDARPGDRLLAVSTVTFDIAALELFLPLLTGGTVVMAGEETRDGRALGRKIAVEGITILQATPATYQLLILAGWMPRRSLKLLCGGEALPLSLADELTAKCDAVWNVYGPTETTIWSSSVRISKQPKTIHLGQPVDGTSISLLDNDLWPVPQGAIGEICIGGVGVARGYWEQSSLTARSFVPDPFGVEQGGRIYRTGDLGRVRQDGTLEFLGRRDRQVKVRGFRVELGEIEAALLTIPHVREAAAIVQRGGNNPLLVAFLVHDGNVPPRWRDQVGALLPAFMVPNRFVVVDSLPLNASCKVDYRRLESEAGANREEAVHVAPPTSVEAAIARIWAQVMERPAVGVEEDFFMLGGHSLMAARIVARLRSDFDVEVPLRALFENPTIRGVAAVIVQLKKQAAPSSSIERAGPGETDATRLSFAQERLFFLSRFDTAPQALNVSFAARFHYRLDIALLQRAVDLLTARHEALRTEFHEDAAEVRAVVREDVRVRVEAVDHTIIPRWRQDEELADFARGLVRRTFDLGAAPLVRLYLISTGLEDSVLVVVLHHMIADGESVSILVRELAAVYRDIALAKEPVLPPLHVRFSDFAAWQRRRMTGDVSARLLDHWLARIAGAEIQLPLTPDRNRPASVTGNGARIRVVFSHHLAEAARAFSRGHGVTIFITLLAAWQELLYRYTGCPSFLVGTPVSNRDRVEIENVIGLFAGTLVLRADLTGDPSFAEHCARAAATWLDAYEHRELPFETLVGAFGAARDISRHPLFQTMFTFNQPAVTNHEDWEPLRVDGDSAKFELTLAMSESAVGLTGEIEYNSDLFEPESIVEIGRRYVASLEAALKSPDVPLSSRPLDAGQLIRSSASWTSAQAVIDRFFAAASRAPNVLAIVSESALLTYADLASEVREAISGLRTAGAGCEDRVVLRAERTPATIATMLGVLGAGAAFVPIDPAASPALAERMIAAVKASYIWHGEMPRSVHGDAARLGAYPESAAYVIVKSRSTEMLRGVVVSHRALEASIEALLRRFEIGPGDRVLQFLSLALGSSVVNMLAALASGATLVLAPEAVLDGFPNFLRYCAEQAITVLDVPTVFWQELAALAAAGQFQLPQCVRLVLIGGEPDRVDYADMWRQAAAGAELVNTYGSSEAMEVTCHCHLQRPEFWPDARYPVPLGVAMPGVNLLVLDERLCEVAPEMAGDLYIAGEGLARGYLADARATASAFLPNPFSPVPGARMYRTGDRARLNRRRQLEFLGRTGPKTMVQGARMEAADVEELLTMCPDVAEAAVALAPVDGRMGLAACVVPSAGRPITSVAVRRYLSERLPGWLMPATIAVVERIPRTYSGKADGAAIVRAAASAADARLSGDTIADLQLSLWSHVLGVPVRWDDNFFELGGNSLQANRLSWVLEEALQRAVPVRAIFEHPTPAAIDGWLQAHAETGLPRIPKAPVTAVPRCTVDQERIRMLVRHLPGTSTYNINAAVRIEARIDPGILAAALRDVILRHPVLASCFGDEPEGESTNCAGRPPEIGFYDLTRLEKLDRESAARELAEYLRRQPFDLSTGPLLRLTLLRSHPEQHVLLLTIHHIVADGMSIEIFFRELAACYRARISAEPFEPPTLETSYSDYAAWQRTQLSTGLLSAQLAYWRRILAPPYEPMLSGIELIGAGLTYRVERRPIRIDSTTADQLQSFARFHRATPFIVTLAAWELLLHRSTGCQDMRVATMAANRRVSGTRDLIGLFVNTVALRTSLANLTDFGDAVRRVRATVISALDRQEVPFEAVLRTLEQDGLKQRAAVAPVLFLWQNSAPPAAWNEWRVSPFHDDEDPALQPAMETSFRMIWEFTESADGIKGHVTFRKDLVDGSAVGELIIGLERFLEEMRVPAVEVLR